MGSFLENREIYKDTKVKIYTPQSILNKTGNKIKSFKRKPWRTQEDSIDMIPIALGKLITIFQAEFIDILAYT